MHSAHIHIHIPTLNDVGGNDDYGDAVDDDDDSGDDDEHFM